MSVPATRSTGLQQWSETGLHRAQLDSGAWVKFRFPDLSMLAAAGKVPDNLTKVALARIARELKDMLLEELPETAPGQPPEQTVNEEVLSQNHDLNNWLITQMIAQLPTGFDADGEPTGWEDVALTPEEVEEHVPLEDKLRLIGIAERDTDVDARGVVIGVTPLSRYARFLHAHRRHQLCGEDCPGCADLRNEERTLRAALARDLDLPMRSG